MRKSSSILLVTALFFGLIALAVAPAQANFWCTQCANDPNDCFACCKCDGYTTYYCAEIACGAPESVLAPVNFEELLDENQSTACTTSLDETAATDEALADGEVESADEAKLTEEVTDQAASE